MNKIILIGNVTKDVNVKSGEKWNLTSFDLAVNNTKDNTLFIKVSCWNEIGKIAEKYVKKGQKVCVVGKLESQTVEKDGKKNVYFSINCETLEFLNKKENEEKENGNK